jgi:4-hydroxybenzoate polyprenyltransferase
MSSQDEKDDEKTGVKSMVVWLGETIHPALSLFGLAFFVCLLWAGTGTVSASSSTSKLL